MAKQSVARVPDTVRPSHVIFFRDNEIERGVKALARFSGTGKALAKETAGILGDRSDDRATLAYADLGVATMRLSKDELKQLEMDDALEMIRPNKLRWSPIDPCSRAAIVTSGGASAAGINGYGPSAIGGYAIGGYAIGGYAIGGYEAGKHPAEGLLAYLRGNRDAVSSLVSQLERAVNAGSSAAPAPSPAAAIDADKATYGVAMVAALGQGKRTGKGVKVAVLDSGIDLDHPEFKSWLTPARCKSFVTGESQVSDGVGHGTHVAGTVAGRAGFGGAAGRRFGVAPQCDLHVGRVLNDQGEGWDHEIVAGIQWAHSQGCRIVNLSLGSERAMNAMHSKTYQTIAGRLLNKAKGTLLVAAAGNESYRQVGVIAPVGDPAACPSVMAVAALDSRRQIAWFSCGGVDKVGAVDVAAPGVDVYSTVPMSQGGYSLMSGTSMAAPHATGVAACLLEANPAMTPKELWARIKDQCVALPLPSRDVGVGLVQI